MADLKESAARYFSATSVILPGSEPLITDRTDLAAVRAEAYRSGMKTLRLSGAMKVAQGVTTMEEVLKVAPSA